jgi:serine/threonine-protein kinase
MKRIKIIYSTWFLCSLLTLAILWALLSGLFPLKWLEYKAYDLMAGFRHQESESPVVIVAIDNKSIHKIGTWPWPRSYIADMVRRLSDYGANTLGIHLLYSKRELNDGLDEIKSLRESFRNESLLKNKKVQNKIEKILLASEKRLNHEAHLIYAVKSATNVVLPIRFVFTPNRMEDSQKTSGWLRMNALDFSRDKGSFYKTSRKFGSIEDLFHEEDMSSASAIISPFQELSTKAGGLGHINLIKDKDGFVRKVPLFIEFQGRYFPSFSLLLAAKYLNEDVKAIQPFNKGFAFKGLQTHSRQIPTDSHFRMLIDFALTRGGLQTFSFSDVLAGDIPADTFCGKIVILGVTADEIASVYKAANLPQISNVEIAANVVENIINQRYLIRPVWAIFLEALVLLYFCFFLIFIIPKVNHRIGALILGISLITWIGYSAIFFVITGYWFEVCAPVVLSFLGYALVMYKTFSQKKLLENAELNKMLGLSFQGQGMLDMAYERFLKCPVEDQSVKELFYNLGLDFERKRMFNKALIIYNHILKGGKFRDIKKRIEKLRSIEEKVVLSATSDPDSQDETLFLEDLMTSPTLGRYEIFKELGQGAMGSVYVGRDPAINRTVAIKTLKYGKLDRDHLPEIKKHFFQEAEAAGRLSHPNIVTIYDVGEDHDLAYIAMELINGKELTNHCKKGRLLSVKRVLKIIRSVAEALAYAHSYGVVHRDIKPANIMLLENGEVKVADFGIARFMSSSKTSSNVIMGTPNYMSPEQVEGKIVDGRSDLFSLGIVFYEMLTGEKPFKGENINHLLYAISKVEYIPLSKLKPQVPPCCARIVGKLLTKSVTQRIQSADKLVEQIHLSQKKLG